MKVQLFCEYINEELKTKIFEKPEGEYSILELVLPKKTVYLQKSDTNYGIQWYEVFKNQKGYWQEVEQEYTKRSGYADIGASKSEAIKFLEDKYK